MFIARSAARVRLARLGFLLLCLGPTAGLTAWAVHRRSEAHRVALEQRWQEILGVPLAVRAVDHPRPGVIRLEGVALPAAGGGVTLRLPLVELESSANEDRLRVPRLRGDAAAAAVLIGLARDWLIDDVRFRRTCVIEVADFAWTETPAAGLERAPGPRSSAATLRIECVARPEARALRIVHRSATDDEVRIVRGPRPEAADEAAPPAITITADCRQPVPLDVVAVAAGLPLQWSAACREALVAGTLTADWTAAGWSGSAQGSIGQVSLEAAAAAVGGRASGIADVTVSKLVWTNDRLSDGLFECTAGPGSVGGRLFDRFVMALGARPGSAARPLPPGGERPFDLLACLVALGPHGVQILPTSRMPAAIAAYDREPLLLPPPSAAPSDRVAWLLSAPGTTFGPAAGPGAWLISVLPNASEASSKAESPARF